MKHLAVIFVMIIAVSCGVKSPSGKPNLPDIYEDKVMVTEYPVCADDLRLNDVPSAWTEVSPAKLITNKKKHFEAVKVRSLINTALEGHPVSVASEAEIEAGRVKKLEVTCQNLTEGEFLRFSVEVPAYISQKDGALYRSDRKEAKLLKLNFDLKDGIKKDSNVTFIMMRSAKANGLDSDSPMSFMQTKSKTIKFYRLPEGDLEVRKSEVVRVNGEDAEFMTIIRYRLAD